MYRLRPVRSCCARSQPRPGLQLVYATQAQIPPPRRPQPPRRIDPQSAGPWQQQPNYTQQPMGGPAPRYDALPPTGPPPLPPQPPPPKPPNKGPDSIGSYAKALIAAAFIGGVGLGVYFDAEVTLAPGNISSTEIIDRNTPNADICLANGYSSSVFDMKLYVTYNPFNVYVTQPVVKSGCVLRRANVGLLEREKLVTNHEVESCKANMNTFAFTGDLKDAPEVACVYHSEEAENQYLMMNRSLFEGRGSSKNKESQESQAPNGASQQQQ